MTEGLDPAQRFFAGIAQRVARRPKLWLLALVVTAIPPTYLSSRLPLEGSFFALLPEHERALVELHRGIGRTGGTAYAIVAIDAHDRKLAERYADAVAVELEKLPAVRFAEARRELSFIRKHALLYLSPERLEEIGDDLAAEIDARTVEGAGLGLGLEDKKNTKTSTVPKVDLDKSINEELVKADLPTDEYSVGQDGRYLYVFIALRGDAGEISRARESQAALERTALAVRDGGDFPKDLEVRFAGSVPVRLEDDNYLRGDFATASTLSFIAVVGLLVLYTRRIRSLVLLSVPLTFGLVWTFGFAWLAAGRLNIISGFLVSILSGLGIEYSIHLLLRYLEARGQGEGVDQAQTTSLRTTGRALVGSGLANAGAFFVVMIAGFKGFSEFGLIAGVGMLLTLVITVFAFPAVNLSLEHWRPMKVKPLGSNEERGLYFPSWIRTLVLVTLPILVVVSIGLMAGGQPRFRTNWREIKGESPASDFNDYITNSLGVSQSQAMLLVEDRSMVPQVSRVLKEYAASRKERNLPNGIKGHITIDHLIPPDQDKKLPQLEALEKQLLRIKPERLDDAGRAQLEHALELARMRPFDISDVPKSLKQRLLSEDQKATLVLLRTTYEYYESDELVSWANEMDELSDKLAAAKVDAWIISENWAVGSIFRIIAHDGPLILGLTIIVIFGIILLDFRNLSHAAVVMGALMFGFVSLAGAMAMTGLELNFMNVAVIPIIAGVSVDNSMHILHRYLEEGPSSIPLVMRHTVAGTTLSSATNLMGFGALIVAHNGGLRSVAHLAILGVALTYWSTSIYFPLFLSWRGDRRLLAKSRQGSV